MLCPHRQSPRIRNLNRTTDLGYAVFRCGDCRRKSNERTGTPFNYLEFPTDIVFEIVLCRLRYKLSLRNLAEMFLLRGFEFTHEAVREWEERFAPLLAGHIRGKRKGKPGRRWYVDETYLKIKGKWSYLYRAIDREGNLVDSMLSATRDMTAAQRFFRSSISVVHQPPKRKCRIQETRSATVSQDERRSGRSISGAAFSGRNYRSVCSMVFAVRAESQGSRGDDG